MLDKEELKDRKKQRETETNIDKARDRRESEDTQSSVQLGNNFFPVSICVLTPFSEGIVLIWHVCVWAYYILFLSIHKEGRFGSKVDGTQCGWNMLRKHQI